MGGVEPTLYRGSVWYTPIVEEWYYQVEVLKLEVGNQNLDLDCREVQLGSATDQNSLRGLILWAVVSQRLQGALVPLHPACFLEVQRGVMELV